MVMSRVAEPGDVDACRLIHERSAQWLVGGLEDGGLTSAKGQAWSARLAACDIDAMKRAADRVGARFAMSGDPEWPTELDDLCRVESGDDRRGGEPFGLWLRGDAELAALCRRSISIVGARAATDYGEYVGGALAAGCVARGYVVVSGGAYGIDAAAHRGALAAAGPTIAVLASGIDRCYPAGNTALLQAIATSGLLISEAAPGCTPTRSRFLVRNRLIAALGSGTVVVEAALRSGSLNTARWARDLGRPVMGVPGPVTSMLSAGVHELLRQPETVLVTDADEVVELIAPIGDAPAPRRDGVVVDRDRLDATARALLDAVPKVAPAPTASIAVRADLSPADALPRLAELARGGWVVQVGAGWRLTPTSGDAP